MCWSDIATGHLSCWVGDDAAILQTWRCPGSSVPLTVVFILRSDRVLCFVTIMTFCVHHLVASRSVGFG